MKLSLYLIPHNQPKEASTWLQLNEALIMLDYLQMTDEALI